MRTVSSMNYASVLMTITPHGSGFPPLAFEADVFFNEEEFLSEPQPDRDRARYFAANDGIAGQYIDIFAKAGKRDITMIDGDMSDQLIHMASSNPQPLFDLDFLYQRNDQLASEIRTQRHTACKFMNHPFRALSNDIVVIKFTIHYGNIGYLNYNGSPV